METYQDAHRYKSMIQVSRTIYGVDRLAYKNWMRVSGTRERAYRPTFQAGNAETSLASFTAPQIAGVLFFVLARLYSGLQT